MIDSAKCFFLGRHDWRILSPFVDLKACARCGKVKAVHSEER